MMKRTKRLLALALAGVLAGQMGVVAWGTQTEPAPAEPACKVADHGQSGHDVTNVNGCTAGMPQVTHWLGGAGTIALQGGAGTNYYYVRPNNQVNCSTGKNYIVVDPTLFKALGSSFTVMNFVSNDANNKIYILGAKDLAFQETDPEKKPITENNVYNPTASMSDGSTISFSIEIASGGSIIRSDLEPVQETGLSKVVLKVENKTLGADTTITKGETSKRITATPNGGVTPIAYMWERYIQPVDGTETLDSNFTNTNKTNTCTVTADGAVGTKYRYKCIATDRLGFTEVKETTVTVSGCDKAVNLEEITSNPALPTGPIYSPENDETFVLSCPIKEGTSGKCIGEHNNDTTHGHTVVWSVSPENHGVAIVEADGKTQLKVTAKSLPDNKTPFTITAKPDGQDSQVKTATFTAKKYVEPACNMTLDPEISGNAQIKESDTSITYNLKWGFDESKCTIPDHEKQNHDYKVASWSFQQGTPDYVTWIDSNSTGEAILHIDPQKLPATEQTLTLTATIAKEEPVLFTNDVNATPDTREVTKDITFKGRAASTTCNAVPTEITAKDGPKVTFATGDTEKIVELTLGWSGCTDSHANHDNRIEWTRNSEAFEWANVADDNGKGKLTITKDKLPNATGNKVIVTATITKPDGTSETRTIEISADRPPNCNKKITQITRLTGVTDITVEQGGIIATRPYSPAPNGISYSGTTCECGDKEHNGGLHNEVLIWEIADFDNTSNVIDEDNAFKIDEKGILTVRGDKLRVGTYHVNLRVSVKDSNVTLSPLCKVNIYCTTPDDDDDDSDHWESYEDKIEDAKRGSTVKMDLTGNGEVPFYVFESARGRDVTLQMKAGKNYTWTINGKTMKKWPAGQIYLPLEVETLKDKTLTRLCRDNDVRTFKLRHEGSFYGDMKLTVDVGVGNAKKTMYLYSYDEDKERLTYQACALADNDGDATFVMTRSLGAYAVTSKALYGEKPVSGGGGPVSGSGSGPVTVYPPVAPATPSSSQSSASSSSSGESSSESEPALPPEPPSSSREPAAPADTDTKPKDSIPVLIPVLILAIAGVITATVLVVRSSRGRLDDFDD